MKTRALLVAAAVVLVCVGATLAGETKSIFEFAGAEAPQTGKDFKPAPETMETRFGNLEFPGGYPTAETVRRVFDELDLQRATQLYLDMYPALSMHGLLKGVVRDYGVRSCSDVFVTANRLDSNALFLTGNTESLYAFIVVDLKADGPTVVEVPAGVMGPFDDHNFKFVFDIGPTGKDQGKGGKYLVLPPDYEGDVPDGYFVFRSPTYLNFSFIRANAAVVGYGDTALDFYRENTRVYPLAAGPRETHVKDVTGMPINTLVPEDASAFEWMHEIINYEPPEAFGEELLGRLASLGILRDEPFAPDARMQEIFAKGAAQGVAMSRVIAFDSRNSEARIYPDRMWESPFIGNSSTFDPNGYLDLEARTTFHFTADGITPAMAAQMPEGTGSRYQTTYRDREGNYLDGSRTYKLNVPPNVPVALFWSVVIYDPWTRCEIQSQPYPSISSQQTPAPQANADGSVDIYFAAERPDGTPEQNWIRVLPDRGFFVYMRYYGPLAAFNDGTWQPNDVELIR